MNNSIYDKTKKVAKLYFENCSNERPYKLWSSFDKEFGKDLSLFITGQIYAREVIPHTMRQLITISVLTVLGKLEELELHIYAALNVGCKIEEISEVIFQTFTYAGIPSVNNALKIFRKVLKDKNLWPIEK